MYAIRSYYAAGTSPTTAARADRRLCSARTGSAAHLRPSLTAQQMDAVKKYRAEGEALHKAGKHPQSEATLAKAMKILGI